jgi:cell division septation protein DedD
MSDEQFHEFHLDGKQMVFLFMASTVVAVVIFLCGVMVGRGVRASRVDPVVDLAAASEDQASAVDSAEPAPDVDPPPASPNIPDDFSYPRRLQSESPAPEPIRQTPPGSARNEPPPPVPEEPAPAPKLEARTNQDSRVKEDAKAATAGLVEPPGPGYSVQVASVQKLSDAEAIGNTLVAKRYPAFITSTPTAPKLHRVRVGKYPTLKDAKDVEERLKKIEKFRDAWTVPR